MIQDYVKAGYPALWVRTHEPERFVIGAQDQINGRTPYIWDVVRGFKEFSGDWQECDPYDVPEQAARQSDRAVWFLSNYHFFINEPAVIQAIQNNLGVYKAKGVTLVVGSSKADLPKE